MSKALRAARRCLPLPSVRYAGIVEEAYGEVAVATSSPTPKGDEEIFRNCVRLIPVIRRVLAGPPGVVVIDRAARQVRESRACRAIQHGERGAIACQLLRVDEPEEQLVVAIGREAVLLVEASGDRRGIEPVEPQHLLARGLRAGDRMIAAERRHPLAEGSPGREPGIVPVPV